MKKEHRDSELRFYSSAYKDNKSRRQRKFSWEKTASKTIIKIIKNNGLSKGGLNKSILDLGCGDKRHTDYFLKSGYSVAGVDFCKEAVDYCRKRFKGNKNAFFKIADLTEKNALASLGKFDTILDWSVLDHIRKKYLKTYISNMSKSLNNNGYLILAEFNENLPGLFKNKRFKIVNRHYSHGYTIKELISLFPKMKLIDSYKDVLEDEINNYRFNTLILQNT